MMPAFQHILDRSHQDYAPTSEPKTGLRLPRISGLLQKIHQELC